jgi:hypothetical protein
LRIKVYTLYCPSPYHLGHVLGTLGVVSCFYWYCMRAAKHSTIAARALDRLDVLTISRTVTSKSTVFGHWHVMASACFRRRRSLLKSASSFASKSRCRRLADAHLRWATPQKRAPQYLSAHVTHVACDISLGTTRRRIRSTVFVRSLSPLRPSFVARIALVYNRSPGLGQRGTPLSSKYRSIFPPLCIRIVAASRLKHYARYELAAVPLEPRGSITDCVTTSSFARAAHTERFRFPHTHSAAAARITTRLHRSPSISARVLVSGTQPTSNSHVSCHLRYNSSHDCRWPVQYLYLQYYCVDFTIYSKSYRPVLSSTSLLNCPAKYLEKS